MDCEVYSVPEFCSAHGISRGTFYNLAKANKAPRFMKVGERTLISKESAAKWRREREDEAQPTERDGSANDTQNPTAEDGFYEVRHSRGRWHFNLVKPGSPQPVRMTLDRFGSLDVAVAHAREAGRQTKRSVRLPAGVA